MADNDSWRRLGIVIGGMGNAADDAYRERLSSNLTLGQKGTTLQRGQMELEGLVGLGDRLVAAGMTPEQAAVVSAAAYSNSGSDISSALEGLGKAQEQRFRQSSVDAALAGNWNDANANLFGVASGPQALATVEGDTLLGNRFVEGGDMRGPTAIGGQRISTMQAQSRASDASAANSYASAARTQQGMGIDAAEFGLKRAGQWNPGGTAAAGSKPIPVGALNKLLDVEDALGATEALNSIIQKHSQRLANGELDLGPMGSLLARGRTAAGMATDGDVAINEWNADLTRIVNESLRLNKGVQTEGDAQRAANELMSANDPRTAARALRRLAEFNTLAVQLQQRKAGLIRGNYGQGQPGIGDRAVAPPAAAPAARRRFNPATGRIE